MDYIKKTMEELILQTNYIQSKCEVIKESNMHYYISILTSGLVGLFLMSIIISLQIQVFTLDNRLKYVLENYTPKALLTSRDSDCNSEDSSSTVGYEEEKIFNDFIEEKQQLLKYKFPHNNNENEYSLENDLDIIDMEKMVDIDLS